VAHVHNGVFFSQIEEGNYDTCYKMDVTTDHIEWKKPSWERWMSHGFANMWKLGIISALLLY
jgi:hypothetical protein